MLSHKHSPAGIHTYVTPPCSNSCNTHILSHMHMQITPQAKHVTCAWYEHTQSTGERRRRGNGAETVIWLIVNWLINDQIFDWSLNPCPLSYCCSAVNLSSFPFIRGTCAVYSINSDRFSSEHSLKFLKQWVLDSRQRQTKAACHFKLETIDFAGWNDNHHWHILSAAAS